MELILLIQLYLTLRVLLLNILLSLWFFGKCYLTNFRYCFSTLLFTLLEYGGLNQIIFCFRLFFFALLCLSTSSLIYSRFSWNPLFFSAWDWLLKYLKISETSSNEQLFIRLFIHSFSYSFGWQWDGVVCSKSPVALTFPKIFSKTFFIPLFHYFHVHLWLFFYFCLWLSKSCLKLGKYSLTPIVYLQLSMHQSKDRKLTHVISKHDDDVTVFSSASQCMIDFLLLTNAQNLVMKCSISPG